MVKRFWRPQIELPDVPGLKRELERAADMINDPSITKRTPSSATAKGNPGDFAWDADYLYICIAIDTWRRAAHASW